LEISVGIPSYNEGASLPFLISRILSQKLPSNIRLREVIISDDSDDETAKLLEEFSKNEIVKVLHHQERRGVSAAWNEILTEALGEIIVLVDADTIPSPDLLASLSSKISSDVGLVAANSSPLPPKSFFARASFFVGRWLQEIRRSFEANQFTVIGRALAIRSDIAKKITLPKDLLAPDLYISCRVRELGYDIAYAEDAIVHFKPTESVKDFASQVVRASLGHKQLKEYSRTTLRKVSFPVQIAKALKVARNYPLCALATVMAYILLPFTLPRVLRGASNYLWEVPETSKFKERNMS
jgi:glycosyltransferase involved in cell wall biosynthesis